MAITVIMQDSRPDGAGGTYKKGSTYSLPDTLATYFIDIGLAKRTSTRSEQTGLQITGDSAGRFPSAPAQDAEDVLKVRRSSAQGAVFDLPDGGKQTIGSAPFLPVVIKEWQELPGSDIYPICSRLYDGYTYGYTLTGLQRSTDGGVTWAPIGLAVSTAQLLLPTGDGEVLVVASNKLYRTTGWGRAGVTATLVHTLPAGWFQSWGVDTDPATGRGVCTHYDVDAGFANSRYIWYSSDYCRTWSVVRDDVAAGTANNHYHFVVFDTFAPPRMYFSSHGVGSVNMGYSDDGGNTWSYVDTIVPTDDGGTTSVHCCTAVPTPAGIVMGTDDLWEGVLLFNRETMRLEKLCRAPEMGGSDLSVKAFATYSQYDAKKEVVYTVYNQGEPAGLMYIIATDGVSANVVYTHDASYPVTGYGGVQGLPGFFGFALTGIEILATARRPSLITPTDNAFWLLRAKLPRRGVRQAVGDQLPVYRGKKSKPMCPAVWLGSEATGISCLAFGYNAKATAVQNALAVGNNANGLASFSTLVGNNASTGSAANSYAVIFGDSGLAGGAFSVQVGYQTTAGANGVGVGAQVVAKQGSVGIGHQIVQPAGSIDQVGVGRAAKTSSYSVAVGAIADASPSGAVSVGYGAKVTHANSISLGKDTASARANSVAVGPRDIEIQGAGLGFITRSPNGTLYRITVADGGTLTVTAI